MVVFLPLAILSQIVALSTPFLLRPNQNVQAKSIGSWGDEKPIREPIFGLSSSSSSTPSPTETGEEDLDAEPDFGPKERNAIYIKQLIGNLSEILDKYICTGSPATRERVFNVLDQIESQSKDNDDLVKQAIRMVKRAGVPLEKTFLDRFQSFTNSNELGKTNAEERRKEALERKNWEEKNRAEATAIEGRSALSRRAAKNGKPDLMINSVLPPDAIATVANSKKALEDELKSNGQSEEPNDPSDPVSDEASLAAADKASELLASTGSNFEGEIMGIGGLEDVLSQIKRRVWTPLAAPPRLLDELGIHPVRGLLLYGTPGNGKTLIGRTLGNLLSPMRPVTVVSGPEILDKFVGSSEKNLREIFDNPPDIYDHYRIGEPDGGRAIEKAALHVIVMDEFDSIARARGGKGGKGDQGDAGAARDSVVNQMLAKLDGLNPLPVPTLVIGLTNKRSLIEPALLRPGRFEVQIEVPPPRTVEQRMSILKVHTKKMKETGRILIKDPAPGTVADKYVTDNGNSDLLTYDELLAKLASECDGFSGSGIAGVARAAASHALERSVECFARNLADGVNGASVGDCLVTVEDFERGVSDVRSSMGRSDGSESEESDETEDEKGTTDNESK